MLEKILASENLNLAFKKVISNKGTHGIDGMTSEQFLSYLEHNGENLINSIFNGTYIPQPVRCVKIPKSNGKMRTLGIPTITDRLIQRAMVQILMPIYEAKFSITSFAFRPERGIEDALKACVYYFNRGYVWTVDMDLEKFFDSVCRKKLMQILKRDINDKRVLDLIKLFINSGSIENGSPVKTSAGIPQKTMIAHAEKLKFLGCKFINTPQGYKFFT